MKKNDLTFTIVIPTYYGDPGIIKTVKSIMASNGVGKLRVIVTVDGNPLKPKVKAGLKKLGTEVIENKKRGGQVARIKQGMRLANSKYIILTQDDVLFDKYAISNIQEAFRKNPQATMVAAKILPMPAKIIFEKIIEVGIKVYYLAGKKWSKGDNYLMSSGRCLAFKTAHAKKLFIPDDVINSDAYLYFENKRKRGKFFAIENAIIYNKSPQNITEHLKQSRKFQYSQEELSKYLNIDLAKEYSVPFLLLVKALISEFIRNPIYTYLYFLVFTYTRVKGRNMYSGAKRFWSTDLSTKKI